MWEMKKCYLRVNEQRNILHEIRKRKANWIDHILRRSCLLQQVIEGKIKGQIEVTRRRGRRPKKVLDDLKDRRGYCQLKEEALDRTMWRNRSGRGFGHVVWQVTNDDDDYYTQLCIGLHIKYLLCLSVCHETWSLSTDVRKIYKYNISRKFRQVGGYCSAWKEDR